MIALAATAMPAAGRIHDLTRRRIERALRQRVRYRYVQPQVQPCEDGWIVSSPCCSRNVDPDGGDILVAWVQPAEEGWALHWRDHHSERWVLHAQDANLQTLLDEMCVDSGRVFWP